MGGITPHARKWESTVNLQEEGRKGHKLSHSLVSSVEQSCPLQATENPSRACILWSTALSFSNGVGSISLAGGPWNSLYLIRPSAFVSWPISRLRRRLATLHQAPWHCGQHHLMVYKNQVTGPHPHGKDIQSVEAQLGLHFDTICLENHLVLDYLR